MFYFISVHSELILGQYRPNSSAWETQRTDRLEITHNYGKLGRGLTFWWWRQLEFWQLSVQKGGARRFNNNRISRYLIHLFYFFILGASVAIERKALQCHMEWPGNYIEFRRRELSDTRGNSKSQTRSSGVRKNKRASVSHVWLIRHPARRWQCTLPRDRVSLTRLQAMRGPLKIDRFLLDSRGPVWPGGKAL